MVRSVLIVGGGIGGMGAALGLARAGKRVVLVDADPNWRVYGAGISVTGISLRAFDALGILDEVRERGFVGAGIRLRAVDGSVLMESPRPPNPTPIQSGGGIMRPVLHDILSARVCASGIDVRLGVKMEDWRDDGDGVDVSFSDGRTERFDLVVSAEGIFSDTRQRLFPGVAAPRFTGQGCWRIVAERPAHIDRTEMYMGGPVKLGLNPVSRTHMYLFVLEHVPDNPRYTAEEQLPHLSALLAPFGGDIPAIRAALGPDSQANYRPLEWLLLPAPWYRGRVLLIGDAAHATTPHMASGAGIAAEDGLVLADVLERDGTVEEALAEFMTRRFERARLVVENSVRIGEIEMAGGEQGPASMMLGETMQRLQEAF